MTPIGQAGLAVAVAGTLVGLAWWTSRDEETTAGSHRRLAAYCTNVRTNLRVDAAHLEDSSNPSRQERAAERFFVAAQHSRGDIELCLGELPAEVDDHGRCYVGSAADSDYACLARLARSVETRMR